MKVRLLLSAAVIATAGSWAAGEPRLEADQGTPEADGVTALAMGQKETRDLTTGDTHVYGVAAAKDQFVLGEAFQSGVDVVVTVTDPDGNPVGQFDDPVRGSEYFQFETRKTGLYRVSIAPFEGEQGEYFVRLLRQEPLADTPGGTTATSWKRSIPCHSSARR